MWTISGREANREKQETASSMANTWVGDSQCSPSFVRRLREARTTEGLLFMRTVRRNAERAPSLFNGKHAI